MFLDSDYKDPWVQRNVKKNGRHWKSQDFEKLKKIFLWAAFHYENTRMPLYISLLVAYFVSSFWSNKSGRNYQIK